MDPALPLRRRGRDRPSRACWPPRPARGRDHRAARGRRVPGLCPGLPARTALSGRFARGLGPAPPQRAADAGSAGVAAANLMCVIYSWPARAAGTSLGCCPVPLFDVARRHPSLLAPGDRVVACPGDAGTLRRIARSRPEGHLDLATLSGDRRMARLHVIAPGARTTVRTAAMREARGFLRAESRTATPCSLSTRFWTTRPGPRRWSWALTGCWMRAGGHRPRGA